MESLLDIPSTVAANVAVVVNTCTHLYAVLTETADMRTLRNLLDEANLSDEDFINSDSPALSPPPQILHDVDIDLLTDALSHEY
jgi:hypothetical protein